MDINRQRAHELLTQWVGSESLRRHMYAVEAAMRAYAAKYGEDPELWGIAGLLHDFDYEKYPQADAEAKTGHPFEGVRHMRALGYPDEIIQAILGHALYSGVPRQSQMAKTLFACDELCGFIVAVGKMRSDNLQTLEAKSVKKKLKDKGFAAKVSREDIALGLSEIGLSDDEHIDFVIAALKPVAKELGF